MALLIGVLAVAALHVALAGDGSRLERAAMVSILSALFQSDAIVRANEQGGPSAFAEAAQFQVLPPGARTCLWRGMSALAKATLPAMLSALLVLALGLLAAMHRLLHRCGLVRADAAPARYRRALVSLLQAAYGAVTNVCLTVLAPVLVDGTLYQALHGEPRRMAT